MCARRSGELIADSSKNVLVCSGPVFRVATCAVKRTGR